MSLAPKAIEVILTRHLASYLTLSIFVVDTDGNLVYYNEPAEAILGLRFEETGEMAAAEWTTIFHPLAHNGDRLDPAGLPLMISLREHRSEHAKFWIRGMDGAMRHIDVTAFPLIGQAGRFLGAVALFWESAAV